MQGCRPRRPGRCLGLVRAWGRVRPHARRYAARLRSPWPSCRCGPTLAAGAARGTCPAPLRSTPPASRRETRRHFVPSRSLLGRSRRSAPLRGRWCHRSGPRTALRCRRPACKRSPHSLRACSCRVREEEHAARQALRSPRQTPRPAGRRAWQGAALGRAACARTLAACYASAVRRGAVGGHPR